MSGVNAPDFLNPSTHLNFTMEQKHFYKGVVTPEITNLNSVNVGPTERLLSIIAGSYLAYKGASRLKNNAMSASVQLSASAYLFYRGISGNCILKPPKHNLESARNLIKIHQTITINKPVKDVYEYWRRLGNLPAFMQHLKTVHEVNAIQSVWEAKIPGHLGSLQWEAAVTTDVPYQLLEWKSVPDSIVENSGMVSFSEIRNNATLLDIVIQYRPPAGQLGHSIARLLNPVFEKIIRKDVANFSSHFEKLMEHENKLTTYSRI